MTADPIGGVWSYALELCRGLARSDIEVTLAVMGRRLTAQERAAVAAIHNANIVERDFKLEWMVDPWSEVDGAGEWLLELESAMQPSLIHLNGYAHGALRWRAPCLIVGHSCVYSWFEAVRGSPPPDAWQTYRQAVAAGLSGANAVTAPSGFMLSQLKKNYGSFAAVEPIYNGCSAAPFLPRKKEPFIITAGRLWDPAKNIAVLEKVANKIDWPVYAAGSTAGPDGQVVRLTGVPALGHLDVETLAQWYGRASIFISPAHYEPFGLSILEAALAGCALVLSDIPSLREIWSQAALFISSDDPDQIASVLKKLASDISTLEEHSARARARALEFTPERMCRNYLALYERLVTERGRAIEETFGASGVEK
jgi:glycogen synthase